MNGWAIFRRARITLFCFLVLTCITWATLLAVFLFHEWSHFSKFQKILVVSLLSLYGFTAILVYLMVVIQFHLWWDIARSFSLLVVHSGSSALFTIYSPSFPCLDFFGTETACKKFVFAIFIGCWVLSGIILFFVISLGVMTFIPRPGKSLQETEEVDVPSTPASFIAGRPTDSSFYTIDSRTGFAAYSDGKSPDRPPSPVNNAHGQTITIGPPRLWHGFESPDLRHNNNKYGRTMAMRNAPTEQTSAISGRRLVDPFHHNPQVLDNLSPPPTSIHSRARPGVGGNNSSITENRLNQSSAFPGLKHDHTLSPIPLYGSPSPVTTPRDLATEHTPTLYSGFDHHSSPGDYSQREKTYPDRARPETPSVYSFHSSAASVYPTWVEPNLDIPPLPDFAGFQGPSPYLGLKDPSLKNNAPFATSGSNTPLKPKPFETHGAMQHYGTTRAHQPLHPPVKESAILGDAVMRWITGGGDSTY